MRRLSMNIIKKTLKYYKPIDSKIRIFPPYKSLSNHLLKQYKKLNLINSSTVNHYINNFYSSKIVENSYLFESFWGQRITCNPKAIFDALVEGNINKDRIFIWVANDLSTIPQYIKEMDNVRFVKFNSLEYVDALNSTQTLVNNMPFPTYFIRKDRQKLISPYHGIPIKYMGKDIDDTLLSIANTQRNFLQSTHLFSSGKYNTSKLYDTYDVTALIGHRIHETGLPRIDKTITTNRLAIRRLLNIDASKKLIIYAPTWRGKRGALEAGAAEQAEMCMKLNASLPEDYQLLVSIHQLVRSKLPSGHSIPMLPSELDTNEVLAGTDVLITDYSSIMFDYLVLDRPLILHVPDKNSYAADRGLYFPLENIPATQTETLSELIQELELPKKPSSFGQLYDACLKELLPNEDGKSSQRAIEKIIEDNHNYNDITPQKHKQRILFSVGALLNNGITTSLLNLISAIDYSKYDVFLVIDAPTTDKDPVKLERYFRLDKRCNVIFRCGKLSPTKEEKKAYLAIQNINDTPTDEDEQLSRRLFAREAERIFGDAEFDIAIDFGGYTPFWTLLISNVNAKKKVIYQHNNLWAEAYNLDPKRDQKQLRSVFRMYKWFDTIVSVSKETYEVNRKNLSDFYSYGTNVSYVRNALNPSYIQSRANSPVSTTAPLFANVAKDPNLIKFITAGRLSPEKNQARLLKAFQIVLQTIPNAVLFIAGAGPLSNTLKSLTKKLGISDRVLFTGMLENPYPLIKSCDCLVMSSDYEGQPMVLLEALALGKHCIGTNVPGIKSALKDGNGTLAEPTPEALAMAMIQFATDRRISINFNPDEYLSTVMNDFYEIVCNTQ